MRVQQFVKARKINMQEWLQAFNADKSSMVRQTELSKVFAKLFVPVSRLEQR
jgi:hypothetical protein